MQDNTELEDADADDLRGDGVGDEFVLLDLVERLLLQRAHLGVGALRAVGGGVSTNVVAVRIWKFGEQISTTYNGEEVLTMGHADLRKTGRAPAEGKELENEDTEDAGHAESEGIWLLSCKELKIIL